MALRAGDRAQIADTFAAAGGGKTKLLERIRSQSTPDPSTLVLNIELAKSDAPSATDEPIRALLKAFTRFREIVLDLVDQSINDERRQGGSGKSTERAFQPVTHAVEVAAGKTSPFIKVTTNVFAPFGIIKDSHVGSVTLNAPQGAFDAAVLAGQEDIAKFFSVTLLEALKNRRALLTIDGYEWIADTPLGGWLLDLVRRLKLTVAVVARIPEADLVAQPGTDLIACPLQPLTNDEILELLEQSLPGTAIDKSLVGVVAGFSAGHAHAVGLAAELLQRLPPPEREAKTFATRLAALPVVLAQRYSDMIDAIIEHDQPEIAEAVRVCAIARRFDSGLLEALLPEQAGKGGELIQTLQRYTFVEPVIDPRGGFFSVHEFIRVELDHRFEQADPAGYANVNGLAAAHIAAWLNAYEETDFESVRRKYGGWYRYERDDWQAAVREWLYHQARGVNGPDAGKERQLGRLRFARIVLDAFWWWGCYLDFPFISELLADWRDSQKDTDWALDLERFVADYPTGYLKDHDPQRWERIFRALISVRTSCGVAGSLQLLDEQQRHVRGLIDLFMAHCHRHREPDGDHTPADLYAAARKYYDEAIGIFRDEDLWDLAWTYFESSELELENGGQLAQQHWKSAVDLLPNLGDDELTANLYRVAADASWPNQPSKAFAHHGSAIWHAYLFQGRYQGVRYRPDAYTLAFYAEQVKRALARLIEHAGEGGDPEADLVVMRAPFPKSIPVDPSQLKEWCAAADDGRIAGLFPAAPPLDQLMLTASPFLTQWETNLAVVGEPDAVCDGSAW